MNIRFDRLSLLETFVRIAERQSLSGAARDLGTSQPSISRQLAALENRLGVALARRTTHSVTLTPDGIALLSDARRLLGEWEGIENRYANNDALSGKIRVIAPVALGQSLLVQAAAQFLKDHPAISIEWKLDDGLIRFAEEGCDCWIKIGSVPDDTLVVNELASIERLVVGTPDCLKSRDISSLDLLPWVTLGPFEGSKIELFNEKGKPVKFAVSAAMASDNIFAVREAVLQGVGVAIMPRWFVASEINNGSLVDVAPKLRAMRLPINIALASGTKRPLRVEKFCEMLRTWSTTALN